MQERSILIGGHESMFFPGPPGDFWSERFLRDHLLSIGVPNPVVTDGDVASIKNLYDNQPRTRYYHVAEHGAFVGTPHVPTVLSTQLSRVSTDRASSSFVHSGAWHDVGFQPVDAFNGAEGAWRTPLREHIGGMADYTATVKNGRLTFRTVLTSSGKEDPVTQMVAGIFGVSDEGIIHNQGGNEFISALGSAKALERRGAPSEAIVVNTALIAATIAFKRSVERDEEKRIVGDGYMGELAKKLKATQLTLYGKTYQPDWVDVNDTMFLAVHFANRDVSAFMGDIPTFIRNGRDIKKEEIPVLRRGVRTMSELVVAANREASSPLLYGWIKDSLEANVPVPAENVPGIYFPRNQDGQIEAESYPPRHVYEAAVERVRENCDYASLFFEAHELGIYTAASIATLVGEPDPAVPGFVYSKKWDSRSVPQGGKFGKLNPNERIVYEELMEGTHQVDVDTATPRRSPIAGILLGSLGKEGIREFSRFTSQLKEVHRDQQQRDNPFADHKLAKEFIQAVTERIGEENVRTIVTELHRVAIYFQDDPEKGNKERAEKLRKLAPGGEIRVYT